MVDLRGPLPGGSSNRSIPLPPGGGGSNYDRVKDAVSIVEYAHRFVPEFSERTLRGCCPLCEGGNASKFSVIPERRAGHCFDCDFYGTIIDLEMALHSCTEWEALLKIAEAFGVELVRGQSDRWHASAGEDATARQRMMVAAVERLARHLYRLYCKDYLLSLPQKTAEERKRHREDREELWGCALRVAGDLYRSRRDREGVPDAS